MSLHDYQRARELIALDPPFYALIMAAIMKADNDNKIRLQTVFPWVWAEVKQRYSAPEGKIGEEVEREGGDHATGVDDVLPTSKPFLFIDKDNL